MKVIGFVRYNEKISYKEFFLRTPLLSPRSKSFANNKVSNSELIYDLLFSFLLLLISHSIIQILIFDFEIPNYFQSIFSIFFVYPLTSFFGNMARALWSLSDSIPQKIHNNPFRSRSLSEFWGLRWNLWIRDWLRTVIGNKDHPRALKNFKTFLISGIIHELMINIPFYIYSGQALFGTMTLYFLIQYIGVQVDKQVPPRFEKCRRIILYLFIIVPSPLFVNKGFNFFLGFYNG